EPLRVGRGRRLCIAAPGVTRCCSPHAPKRVPPPGRASRTTESPASPPSASWLLLDERVALGHGVARIHLHGLVLRPVASALHADRVAARLDAVAEERRDADLHAIDVHGA